MKQIFVCVFFLIPLIIDSAVAAYSDLPQDSALVLKARVTDTYDWSEIDKRYSLQNSRFHFKVELESVKDGLPHLVDEGNITQTAEQNARYLSVSTGQVAIESRSGQKKIVRSQLSDDREELAIYFSKKRKDDILNGLLVAVKVEAPLWQHQSSSDYGCQVNKNRSLVCSMSYISKRVQDAADNVVPSSE